MMDEGQMQKWLRQHPRAESVLKWVGVILVVLWSAIRLLVIFAGHLLHIPYLAIKFWVVKPILSLWREINPKKGQK